MAARRVAPLMTKLANLKTSVSAMVGMPVMDAQGRAFGRVSEVAVSPELDRRGTESPAPAVEH